jgi:hypothetical protein
MTDVILSILGTIERRGGTMARSRWILPVVIALVVTNGMGGTALAVTEGDPRLATIAAMATDHVNRNQAYWNAWFASVPYPEQPLIAYDIVQGSHEPYVSRTCVGADGATPIRVDWNSRGPYYCPTDAIAGADGAAIGGTLVLPIAYLYYAYYGGEDTGRTDWPGEGVLKVALADAFATHAVAEMAGQGGIRLPAGENLTLEIFCLAGAYVASTGVQTDAALFEFRAYLNLLNSEFGPHTNRLGDPQKGRYERAFALGLDPNLSITGGGPGTTQRSPDRPTNCVQEYWK